MRDLFDEECYMNINEAEKLDVKGKGIYAIGIQEGSELPEQVRKEVVDGGGFIIFIGMFTGNIQSEIIGKCQGTDDGTFLRQLGALLGFKPTKGSLLGNANTKKFEFTIEDRSRVVEWIYNNLYFNYIVLEDETELLVEHFIILLSPILNVDGNPFQSPLLIKKINECFINL